MNENQIYIGENKLNNSSSKVENELIEIDSEIFNKISNVDQMRPFFMSIVSNANHWMFISSNGGLTAGRKDCDLALFPYYTDDKITESSEITGSKTIFQVHKNNKIYLWEPFSSNYKGVYKIQTNLYKSTYGNKIIFEEINEDLNLSYSYEWNFSNLFGFVKKSKIRNNTNEAVVVSVIDGIQNIIPFGVSAELQNGKSNLVDAYKKNELINTIGVYSLSSMIIDKAEPSEALKATIAYSLGLEANNYLVSSLQLANFRKGSLISSEDCVKGEKGAFFTHSKFTMNPHSEKEWMLVANVNQDQSSVVDITEKIKNTETLINENVNDVQLGTKELIGLVAAADGIQLTSDKLINARHFSNVLFNIMRGGIFDNNYTIEIEDFKKYLSKANKLVYKSVLGNLKKLPSIFKYADLKELAKSSENHDFQRLCLEYLPLKFSRRHGDPSRPWNKFLINTHSEIDGSKILDYQGNWRDIFQNWEALAYSYPEFIEGMILKFLNASTFDGYNPYRVTKDGFDWEIVEPDDPWSYIGYWGDHQIIYLLKLLEICEKHFPKKLENLFSERLLVYANVPYKIKNYPEILKDPKDTIDFDKELHERIIDERNVLGADGTLLKNKDKQIQKANFIEKILAMSLAKFSNFVPGAGIWLNTQRPEWNDANNALVGNGTSMVTTYYLRRFLNFMTQVISKSEVLEFEISAEVETFFNEIFEVFSKYKNLLLSDFNNKERKLFIDELGNSSSNFRSKIYSSGFSSLTKRVTRKQIIDFITIAQDYINHSIKLNKRQDNLYHSYNLITITDDEVSISYLNEMLEGQVAILESGYLTSKQSLDLLDSLEKSKLYRKDIESYILYPNKELKRFTDKNIISKSDFKKSKLLQKLLDDKNNQIVVSDSLGEIHFNASFSNVNYLKNELINLPNKYIKLVEEDKNLLFEIYEDVFNHKYFTGRSGSFFGYEGLGSTYWHMVSKLALSAQEVCLKSQGNDNEDIKEQLYKHYYKINEGLGVHKSSNIYGAFPTDPYSHTPAGKGAQQPGMTGQVKEDILNRIFELGVFVRQGKIQFKPNLLKTDEFITEQNKFTYFDVNSTQQELLLEPKTLAFTYCQVPVIYQISNSDSIEIVFTNTPSIKFKGYCLTEAISKKLFARTGEIQKVVVNINSITTI